MLLRLWAYSWQPLSPRRRTVSELLLIGLARVAVIALAGLLVVLAFGAVALVARLV